MKHSAQTQNMTTLLDQCKKVCGWIDSLKRNDEYTLLRIELEELKKLL